MNSSLEHLFPLIKIEILIHREEKTVFFAANCGREASEISSETFRSNMTHLYHVLLI